MSRSRRSWGARKPTSARASIGPSPGCGRCAMTSGERSSWRTLSADLARIEEALAGGRVTADDPDGRSLQSFALALRHAAPRPREAFVAMLERQLRDDSACTAAVPPPERADEAPAPLR